MKFVPTRALRINAGEIWKLLRQERDLVITSNGKPVGVLTLADEDSLEDVLATLRQGRAQAALAGIRRAAVARGLDRLTQRRVQEVVEKARKVRSSLAGSAGLRRANLRRTRPHRPRLPLARGRTHSARGADPPASRSG